jgi:fructose-bisphosphate aldolase class I
MSNLMKSTIEAILARGKGILAADESTPSIKKRLAVIHLESTEETRESYREMLFTTPGVNEFISGVILFDETLRQKTKAGVPLSKILSDQGIIPGIKVDEGAVALPNFPGEKWTQGLDGLRERLEEYRGFGARFAKWRAVITIGDGIPTRACIEENAFELALYAALCQEAGLVPIVEPEVLMDGNHTIERCEEVITTVLESVFDALIDHRVVLEEMLLKSGMVLSGKECPMQAGNAQITEATIRCFLRSVPAAVPGIVFLSGGQNEEEATERLNGLCKVKLPWRLTFSYGRALQDSALKTWGGSPDKIAAGQAVFHHRAKCNGLAVLGKYSELMESASYAV